MGMTRTATAAPTRKVLATVGGGEFGRWFAEVFVYFLEQALGHELPDRIEGYFIGMLAVVVGVAAGYLMPPAADEVAVAK